MLDEVIHRQYAGSQTQKGEGPRMSSLLLDATEHNLGYSTYEITQDLAE